MFRRLLVPLDGSYRAEQAIPVAARLARANGGIVSLLQVITSPLENNAYLMQSQVVDEHMIDDDIAAATAYLKIVASSSELRDLTVECEVSSGTAAEVILYDAQSHPVDMIVMCSHGRSGFTRWMLGSVAQQVARHSQAPVLIVREPVTLHQEGIPTRVLVTLDGSPLSEAVLEPAAQLSAALSAPAAGEVHLLRVLHDFSSNAHIGTAEHITNEMYQQALERVTEDLHATAEHLLAGEVGKLNVAITSSVVCNIDVAEQIIAVAERGEDVEHQHEPRTFDIIAMATHGRKGISRMVLGSVTERVLSATRLPLLIVRPVADTTKHQKPLKPVAYALPKS